MEYLQGFGNYLTSEALPGALPQTQNSPQKVPYNLYVEQYNGSAFTSLRSTNLHSWVYRLTPSVAHNKPWIDQQHTSISSNNPLLNTYPPIPLRWNPLPFPSTQQDFIESWVRFAGCGSPESRQGARIYLYACNQSMQQRFFSCNDGDLLIIPEQGKLLIHTEFGALEIEPGEICVIYRGIYFTVELLSPLARGYILEQFGAHFTLPERGVIGANGLANERDFFFPTATYQENSSNCQRLIKFNETLWLQENTPHPLDVVAWHGNYVPYKYDLRKFNAINSVSYDHPDPSIFTVLTAPSATPGTAHLDFVIFPERWSVAEHTFRPPYFHKNIMSEWMGLVYGVYDAKAEGFHPGGCSLHNIMVAHGPDKKTYELATQAELKPIKHKNILAFMFESYFPWQPSLYAMESGLLQENYVQCWQNFPRKTL